MSGTGDTAGILHLLLSADDRAWRECRSCARGEDTVVLLADGVMGLTGERSEPAPDFPCRVAASAGDARARGLPAEAADDGLELITDPQLVGLIEAHGHCLSWR